MSPTSAFIPGPNVAAKTYPLFESLRMSSKTLRGAYVFVGMEFCITELYLYYNGAKAASDTLCL